jgi:hypothetical protein
MEASGQPITPWRAAHRSIVFPQNFLPRRAEAGWRKAFRPPRNAYLGTRQKIVRYPDLVRAGVTPYKNNLCTRMKSHD